MTRSTLYLWHIQESFERIEEYSSGGKAAFENDKRCQDAVMHVIEESALRLPDEMKSEFPKVDWRSIRGFRNTIVHDYLKVDLDTIWNII